MKIPHITGLLFVAVLAAALSYNIVSAQDDDESGEEEVTVTLDETPDAVKQTLLNELASEIGLEIEREVENGVTVYDAEFEHNGQEIEFEISADGELLEKEVGDEEDDDEDDG